MAKYSKNEWAVKCGMRPKDLAVYIGRKKVFVTPVGEIDETHPLNNSFLEKYSARAEAKAGSEGLRLTRPLNKKERDKADQENLPPKYIEPIEDEDESGDDSPSKNAYFGMEAKKLATQIRKMEKEIEKLTLGNQKARGQVVPVHLIDSLFLQERQSILTEMKNVFQDVLTLFAKRRDLTAFERTDISAEITDRLNEAMQRAAAATVSAVDGIVSEFSIKKGKGERE